MAAEVVEVERLDRIAGWPVPEERGDWLGDPPVETRLLDAYRSGRMHHAWLLGGPKGIGKATLAYRFARFILAHPNPAAPDVQAAESLAVAADHPAFRRVASRSHPSLLALERPYRTDLKRYMTALTVDEIRRTVSFFGSTAGEGGWRIAIVDSADDMNASAANALLKVLEEPPAHSLFLILAHAPGRLMQTIRSRCRRLELTPLSPAAITAALAANAAETGKIAAEKVALTAALADGSLRRAILLIEQNGADSYRSFLSLVDRFPDVDIAAMHAFADRIAARGADDAYDGFFDMLRGWLDRRVRRLDEPEQGTAGAALAAVPLARWTEVWEKAEESTALADELNLDRKQVVLSILMALARATRM